MRRSQPQVLGKRQAAAMLVGPAVHGNELVRVQHVSSPATTPAPRVLNSVVPSSRVLPRAQDLIVLVLVMRQILMLYQSF